MICPLDKITTQFQQLGYTNQMKITKNKFSQLLDQLLKGHFDQYFLNQWWQQAQSRNNFGQQILIKELVNVINQTLNIFKNNIKQCQKEIKDLQKNKKQIEKNHDIQYKIQHLKNEIKDFQDDLNMIIRTFRIELHDIPLIQSNQSKVEKNLFDQIKQWQVGSKKNQISQSKSSSKIQSFIPPNFIFKQLLWLPLFIALFSLILVYSKYDFLKVSFCCIKVYSCVYCIMSAQGQIFQYLLSQICFTITLISIILDVVQLISYAFWNQEQFGLYSTQIEFVFFKIRIIMLIMKIRMLYLLIGFRKQQQVLNFLVKKNQ